MKLKIIDNEPVSIGDKIHLLDHAYTIVSGGAKPIEEAGLEYTVVKVGRKRIECANDRGERGFFAYKFSKDSHRTYRRADTVGDVVNYVEI